MMHSKCRVRGGQEDQEDWTRNENLICGKSCGQDVDVKLHFENGVTCAWEFGNFENGFQCKCHFPSMQESHSGNDVVTDLATIRNDVRDLANQRSINVTSFRNNNNKA